MQTNLDVVTSGAHIAGECNEKNRQNAADDGQNNHSRHHRLCM